MLLYCIDCWEVGWQSRSDWWRARYVFRPEYSDCRQQSSGLQFKHLQTCSLIFKSTAKRVLWARLKNRHSPRQCFPIFLGRYPPPPQSRTNNNILNVHISQCTHNEKRTSVKQYSLILMQWYRESTFHAQYNMVCLKHYRKTINKLITQFG